LRLFVVRGYLGCDSRSTENATAVNLAAAIEDDLFRSDLYYRFSVFPIHVPPLRERAEDIPLLVEYLTQRYAAKAGRKITRVSRGTMDLLTAYSWPGNVRELQNVIQRAATTTPSSSSRPGSKASRRAATSARQASAAPA